MSSCLQFFHSLFEGALRKTLPVALPFTLHEAFNGIEIVFAEPGYIVSGEGSAVTIDRVNDDRERLIPVG
jgi:hypothetical protein